MPPVTTSSCSPDRIIRSAISIARMDEAQTLLIVSAGTSFGIPAPTAACRAGACPTPACSTWPMITYSTSPGSRPARSSAARITIDAELRRRIASEPASESPERGADGGHDHRAGSRRGAYRRRSGRHPPARVVGCPHRGRHGGAANAIRRARRGGSHRRGRSACREPVRPSRRVDASGSAFPAPSHSSSRTTTPPAGPASRSSSSSSTTATSPACVRCPASDGTLALHWEHLARLDTLTLGSLADTLEESLELLEEQGSESQRDTMRRALRLIEGGVVTERALDALRSAAPDAYFVLDDDDRILHVSKAFHDTRGRGVGHVFWDHLPRARRGLRPALRGGSCDRTAGRGDDLLLGAAEAAARAPGRRRARCPRREPRRARRHVSRDADAEPGAARRRAS